MDAVSAAMALWRQIVELWRSTREVGAQLPEIGFICLLPAVHFCT